MGPVDVMGPVGLSALNFELISAHAAGLKPLWLLLPLRTCSCTRSASKASDSSFHAARVSVTIFLHDPCSGKYIGVTSNRNYRITVRIVSSFGKINFRTDFLRKYENYSIKWVEIQYIYPVLNTPLIFHSKFLILYTCQHHGE